jgi:DNA-directed RNA polymerase II subunit RPB2
VDLPGSLLLELYRELWGNFKRNTSLKIDSEYKLNHENSTRKADITTLISDSNVSKIFDNKIMDSINKSFGARFGTGISSRQGIVQELNRNVMLGTLSHIRRISTPLPSGSKTIGPRKLHNSQWGFVCPTESPDGGNVGIINHLSIIARVSNNISEDGLYDALVDGDLIKLKNSTTADITTYTNVFLNGKMIGLHREPKDLKEYMKLLKLNSFINITTSISWNIKTNEFHVFTDSGRIIRPIFFLKEDANGDKYNELISGDTSYIENWKKACHGYLYDIIEGLDFTTPTYFQEELGKLKLAGGENYLDILRKSAAVIEYIDSTESENALIGRDIKSFENDHTHCEIHPSLMLSAVALNIPFPEHSQYPRNAFSCQQTKHAVGVYTSAYNTRFETAAHILNYPQRPLVTTRFKKYTDVDKLPYGINAIVAIASYGGYNQEDSVLLNKTSVDRGMFKSLYFRSYEDSETDENGKREYFGNPLMEKNVHKLNPGNFENLDDYGFIKEGQYVTDSDVLCAKCFKTTNGDGVEITKVICKKANFGTSGIVDKVVVVKNKDGLRTCKIRIRKEKIAGVGDKFASRCGQKGMCGLVLEQWEMPFTKDGIVPDIIINPHAIPSRMTINQLLEVVLGKSSCIGGYLGDATPFQNKDFNEFTNVLEGFDYERQADEVMYSGFNGEQIHTSIFIGPTYYQRLKIMAADKMHSRGMGPMNYLTKQPAAGRANNGGLRIGEMERDSILSHGISSFMNESMMERSDKYKVQVDNTTGMISYDNNTESKKMVEMPYTMKLLIQELETMSIGARLVTESSINEGIFEELHNNISKHSIEEDFLADEVVEVEE